MNGKLYLAYGSNLNVNRMLFRCPDAVKIGASFIEGHKLVFRRGVLTIEPTDGMRVPVGVWAVSESDEESLDVYEGFPRFYVKRLFRLTVNGKTVHAMAYVMTPGYAVSPPSEGYYNVCAEGYADFGFDPAPLQAAALESKAASDAKAEAAARKALKACARKQKSGDRYCPRCGDRTLKSRLASNALSRYADVYICAVCGLDEAMRAFRGDPLPLRDWAVAQKRH